MSLISRQGQVLDGTGASFESADMRSQHSAAEKNTKCLSQDSLWVLTGRPTATVG